MYRQADQMRTWWLAGVIMTTLAAGFQPDAAGGADPDRARGRWVVQESGVKDDLQDVWFFDQQTGIVVGHNNTILRTGDGGKSWKRVLPSRKGGSATDLRDVVFSGTKVGWVRTAILETILHTSDGGNSWAAVPLPEADTYSHRGRHTTTHAAVGDSYFLAYWGLAGSWIWRADNVGKNWTLLTKKVRLEGAGIAFPGPEHGIYACRRGTPSRGYAALSIDGGKTWKEQELPGTRGNSIQVQMVDRSRGWLLPQFGTIHATDDGGKTWRAQALGHDSTATLAALHFADGELGHVLCQSGRSEVRRTTDGGKSWHSLGTLEPPGHVHGLSFPGRRHGWVVGDRGYIAHYEE